MLRRGEAERLSLLVVRRGAGEMDREILGSGPLRGPALTEEFLRAVRFRGGDRESLKERRRRGEGDMEREEV